MLEAAADSKALGPRRLSRRGSWRGGGGRWRAAERVPVLEVGEDGGDQGLQDLGLREAIEEAKGDAVDVLIRVLEVVVEVLAYENHLWEDTAMGVDLVDDLQVKQEELLDGVVFGGEDVANDSDEELGEGLVVEEEHDALLHVIDLGRDVIALMASLISFAKAGEPLSKWIKSVQDLSITFANPNPRSLCYCSC